MKYFYKLTLCIGLLPMGLLLPNCKDNSKDDFAEEKAASNAANNATAKAKQALGMPTDLDRIGQKMNPYIKCLNQHTSRVLDSMNRYDEYVGLDRGPKNKRTRYLRIGTVYDPKDCVVEIAKANALPPKRPAMEAAALAYGQSLQTLEPIIEEMYTYFEEEDYKDDDFAKGEELHPQLVSAFQAFQTANAALDKLIGVENGKLQEARISQIEKQEGKSINYHWAVLMLDAKKLVEAMGEEPKDLTKIDLAVFTAALEKYKISSQVFETYSKEHEDKIREQGIMMLSGVIGDANDLRTTAKQLMRRIRDNKPITNRERKHMATFSPVDGSPSKVYADYNDLIESSNRARR